MHNDAMPIGCSGQQIVDRLEVLTEHMIFLEALLKKLVCHPEPGEMELLTTQIRGED